jgi:hypothetical protein
MSRTFPPSAHLAHPTPDGPATRHIAHHLPGVTRRELLQVGYSGFLGLGLPSILAATQRPTAIPAAAQPIATSPGEKPRQVLIVFLTGAASHHDTFDMKPAAPAEVRGEFQPIATSVPGLQICEHLPQLAKRAHKYALVRSFSHSDNNHLMSTHYVLTGELQPGGFFDKVASRTDWPCYAAGVAYLRPPQDGIPSGVHLPTYLLEGPLTWPGQHAGLLGAKYDPWQIVGDPNAANFKVDHLSLGGGLDVQRLADRQQLLSQVNQQQQRLAELAVSQRLSAERDLALSLLTSQRLSRAFELQHETVQTRDQYGRHTTGQSLLLARRLIEVGVPVVQVNIGRVQNWDNHGNIFPTLKDRLLPPLDQGVSALLDDLEQRGLLDNTLVAMFGEFGRTPKINNQKGRDHWGPCFFGLFAGGKVQAGKVIGKSDKEGAYPATKPYSPHYLGATIYQALGISPDTEVRDRLNRPVRLNRGSVIESLYTGAEA